MLVTFVEVVLRMSTHYTALLPPHNSIYNNLLQLEQCQHALP